MAPGRLIKVTKKSWNEPIASFNWRLYAGKKNLKKDSFQTFMSLEGLALRPEIKQKLKAFDEHLVYDFYSLEFANGYFCMYLASFCWKTCEFSTMIKLCLDFFWARNYQEVHSLHFEVIQVFLSFLFGK